MDKNSFDGIPHGFLQKWQEIADLLASILEVPAALIMKNENEFMEVFTTSNTANNPYKPGDKEHWHGLYCETVIKEQKKLRIPNALKDKDWDKNPDIKLGMIAYLGYPLNFPDQSPFGTLCVLDNKERHFSSDNEKLLLQFKKVLEIDLALIFSLELKEDYSHVDLIQKLSQDNEELKKTKEELTKSADHLKHSHELMDYIIKHNRSAIAVHDRDLNYVFVSQRYLDVYKVKETDVIGKHHYDVFPDLPQKWREVHQKSLKGEVISAEEDPYYHEDGRVDWTRWECRPWYEKNGSIGGIIVYTEIITERLQQENDLRKSEENLSITLNSIGDAVISTDINGSVVKMNPVAQKLCGWKLSDAIGKSLPEVFKIINAHSRQSVTNPVEKVMKEGKTVGLANHTVLISRDGNEYQISDSAAPIKNKEGEISGVVMVFSDVTEKYIAERKLKESEERFHLAMNASNDGLWDWNLETNDIYYSPAWKKMLGYQEHELPNDFSVWENLTQPDDVKKSWELQQKLIDKQIDQFVVEFKMRHKQGHWVDILSRAKAIFNDKGKAVRIVGTHTDITERKNYEDALRKSQEMLLTSQSVAHICSYSTNLNITDLEKSSWVCSPQFYEIFGIDKTYPHTIKDWMGFIHPAYRKEMVAYHKSVVDEKKSFNREYKIIRLNDGVERWVHGTGELEYDEQGKPVRMHGAIQDITERKKIEEQIRQSQHLLQAILDNLPIGLAFNKIDEGKATYMNKKFMEIYGWEKRDLVNIKTFFEKVYPDKNYREKVMEQVMTDIKSGDPQKMHWENLTITRKDGTHRIINAVNIPLIDQNTMVSTVLDVTKERQAEEVRKELQVTRKTAQFKQNFLANMSHEIRTPLTGVLGMIEIMEQTSLTDDQKDYLDTIKVSGEHLREIINQVLDYSKIEAGKVSIHTCVFEFSSLPSGAISLYKNNAKTGVEFHQTLDPEIPEWIEADKVRLSQVLNNLVSNAVKFTTQGSISIQSSLLSSDSKNGKVMIKIEVKDTGPGIAEALQKKLFVPFSQIEDEDTRNYEGTGLGLAICKQLIGMMAGEIGMSSQEGKGSTFWFTFPARIAQKRQFDVQKNDTPVSGQKFRILLAEDKVVNQKVVKLMLSSLGHQVVIANNGQEVLNIFQPEKFDLILMDIQMPVMDGVTTTQKLKEKHTILPPIVGLSANAFEGDRTKYMALGMDDYLTKPVKRTDFERLVRRLF